MDSPMRSVCVCACARACVCARFEVASLPEPLPETGSHSFAMPTGSSPVGTPKDVVLNADDAQLQEALAADCDRQFAVFIPEFLSGTAPAEGMAPVHTCNMDDAPGMMQACFLADSVALARQSNIT